MTYKSFAEIIKFILNLEARQLIKDENGKSISRTERSIVLTNMAEFTVDEYLWTNGRNQTLEELTEQLPEKIKFLKPDAEKFFNDIIIARKSNDAAAKEFLLNVQFAAIVFLETKDVRNSGATIAFKKIKELAGIDEKLQKTAMREFIMNNKGKNGAAVIENANHKFATPYDILIYQQYLAEKNGTKSESEVKQILDLFNDIFNKAKLIFDYESSEKIPGVETMQNAITTTLESLNLIRPYIPASARDSIYNDIRSILDIDKAIVGDTKYLQKTMNDVVLKKSLFETENSTLRAENEQLKNDLARQMKSSAILKAENKKLVADMAKLNKDNLNLAHEFTKEQQLTNSLQGTVSELKEQLKSKNTDIQDKQRQIIEKDTFIKKIREAKKKLRIGLGSKGVIGMKKLLEEKNTNSK